MKWDTPRSMHYILDDDHHVIEVDLITWGVWFENISNRRIGYTQITSQVYVSTVFLGLDHGFGEHGPPILFETMIFGGPEEIDERTWRYSSWDDAEIGHQMAVKKARKALGQKIDERTKEC